MQPDLGLHCLLRSVCLPTLGKYDIKMFISLLLVTGLQNWLPIQTASDKARGSERKVQ